MESKIEMKKTITVQKVIGLILAWDLMVALAGWVDWWNLEDPMFFSIVWLNTYLFVTVINVKKFGIGLFIIQVFNTMYDDMLNPSAKINKAKEALGKAMNFLSIKDIELFESKKIVAELTKDVEIPEE